MLPMKHISNYMKLKMNFSKTIEKVNVPTKERDSHP